MSSNGSEGKKDNQNESLWVWIKPASFYNLLETRYNQNRYLLRRTLSYAFKPSIPDSNRAEGNLEVEFLDLSRNMSCANPKQKTRHMRLTVITVVCEKLSDKEFHPLDVNCLHLRGHESVASHFKCHLNDTHVLLIVRGSHHDLSILHGTKRCIRLSKETNRKQCFGCLPVGEHVWWYCHKVQHSNAKIRVNQWHLGRLTVGEKSSWNGSFSHKWNLIALESPTSSEIEGPPHLFNFRTIPKEDNLSQGVSVAGSDVPLSSTDKEVAFRFVYGINQPQCVEQRTQKFGCPLCTVKCSDFVGLRYHLAASHDLFHYEIEAGPCTVVWVRRRLDVYDEDGEIYCPVTKSLLPERAKQFYMNRLAFLRPKPVSKRRRTSAVNVTTFLNDAYPLEAVNMLIWS